MKDSRKNAEEKVTDLGYLLKLSKGNNAFVKDMIRIFMEENPSEIRTLEQAVANRDFKLINSAAHKLRSTVPFVGLDKLISGEISELEKLALDQTGGNPLQVTDAAKAEKNTFLPTDKQLVERIDSLFGKIKGICFRAYDELRPFTT